MRLVSVLFALGFVCTAAGCTETPVPEIFTGPTVVPNPPPVVFTDVRLTGQVVDLDRASPVEGATVTVNLAEPVSVTTGGDGMFELTVRVPEGWRSLGAVVARDGYEAASHQFRPGRTAGETIRVYPTVTVRPGESVETGISMPVPFSGNSYFCWFLIDDSFCRRVVVDAAAGEAVEIELTPHGGLENVGLIDAVQQPAFVRYERRITVTRGEVWIVGNAGPVTLRASRR